MLNRSRAHLLETMCTIQTTVQVTFPDGCPPVHVKAWIEVEGSKFIRLKKSDSRVVRLLTGSGVGTSRALAKTNIIESIIDARNEKAEQLMRETMPQQNAAAEELGGVQESKYQQAKRAKRLAASLPSVIEVDAPSFEHIEGISLNVLLQPNDQTLWVEMIEENLDFLRAVCIAQIESGTVKQPMPGQDRAEHVPRSPAPGVVWASDRASFRARYKDDDGEMHTRDFKQSTLAVAFMRAARNGEPLPLQAARTASSNHLPLQNEGGEGDEF